MSIIIKITKNILLTLSIALFFFSSASVFAVDINNISNEYDSIYRYNALENNISFANLKDIAEEEVLKEKLLESNELDNFTKKLQNTTLKQNFSVAQVESILDVFKNKNGLKNFMIGSSLGVLKFQVTELKEQIIKMNILKTETEDDGIKVKIDDQIKFLIEKQIKAENFILEEESKFSLFRWFLAML